MYCCHCGKELPDGASFCAFCGQKATEADPPQADAPADPPSEPVLAPPSAPPDPDSKQFSCAYRRSFWGRWPRKVRWEATVSNGSLHIFEDIKRFFSLKPRQTETDIPVSGIKGIALRPRVSIYFWMSTCAFFFLAFLMLAAISITGLTLPLPTGWLLASGCGIALLGCFEIWFYKFQLYHYRLTIIGPDNVLHKLEAPKKEPLESLAQTLAPRDSWLPSLSGVATAKIAVAVPLGLAVAVALGFLLMTAAEKGAYGDLSSPSVSDPALDAPSAYDPSFTPAPTPPSPPVFDPSRTLSELAGIYYAYNDTILGNVMTLQFVDGTGALRWSDFSNAMAYVELSDGFSTLLYGSISGDLSGGSPTFYGTLSSDFPAPLEHNGAITLSYDGDGFLVDCAELDIGSEPFYLAIPAPSEYPYPLAGNMDDILDIELWGELYFLDAVAEGQGWDWLWYYTADGSDESAYYPPATWYNECIGEWTIYGVSYDRACEIGWGYEWLLLMSEKGLA